MQKIIRRPDFAGGGITPEEKIKMDELSKVWIARAMRTKAIEPDKIIPAIKKLYAAADLNEPMVVIVPSPLVMAFSYGASSALLATHNATINATRNATINATRNATYNATHNATINATRNATINATRDATINATDNATYNATDNATRDATINATDNATRDATDNATYNATDNATHNATRDATINATDNATRDATYNATRDATDNAAMACYNMAGELGLECAKKWTDVYQGGNFWAGWACYLNAFRDILGLNLKEHKKYKAWEDAAIHGSFRVMHEKFCIVSDFPEIMRIDDNNLSHCEDGPSHRWRDGWELYHWHGVAIPDEWIKVKNVLTPQIALTWENIEQRRCACEILGWDNILNELDAVTIEKDEDPMIGELIEVDLPDIGKEKFLRVTCGTQRTFALPVPPEMKTALQANAWTYNLDGDTLKQLEIRT